MKKIILILILISAISFPRDTTYQTVEGKIVGIWLYAHYPDVEDWVLKNFCEAAVKRGYMLRIVK